MAKALTAIKNERSNTRLVRLTEAMFREFGGLDGFLDVWTRYYRGAMAQGGFAAFRCLESVIRLLQFCEEQRPAPSEMTDQDLALNVREQAKLAIADDPALAILAAQELGWTVIPPS